MRRAQRDKKFDSDELSNLIARCVLQDQRALETLYSLTAGYLNTVAFRIVDDEDLSNEVLQEAFVQIWCKANSYQPHRANPLTWMASVVRYRAIDKLRHERRHQNQVSEPDGRCVVDTIASSHCVEQEYLRTRHSEQLNACLAKMDSKFTRSLELAYLYGYSREELGTALGANVNTVKSWLRRGSKMIKNALQESTANS